MKTPMLKFNNNKALLLIFILFFAIQACGTKSSSSEETQTEQGKTAKVKAPNIDLQTAVIQNNVEAIKQHIAAGSKLNEKDPMSGSTPLITAALFGNKEIAKLLIDGGANMNATNNDGSTALHTAAFFSRPDMVALLLENGADKSVQNNYSMTALQSIQGPFEQTKSIYQMMALQLEPIGLKIDLERIENTRPEVIKLLQ